MTFTQLYTSIDFTSEYFKYKANYSQYSFKQKISLLLLVIKSLLFKTYPEVKNSEILFNCSNLTKFNCFLPYLNQVTQGNVVVTHKEGERTKAFLHYLNKNNTSYDIWTSGNLSYSIIPLLVKSIMSLNLSMLFFTIENYQTVYRHFLVLSKASPKIFVTANEDNLFSSSISKLCKKCLITTINIMHGRAYLNDQHYDHSIIFGKSLKKFLESNTCSSTNFILGKSPFYSSIRPNTSLPPSGNNGINVLFCDQGSFELYPIKTRSLILSLLLKYFKHNEYFNLYVQPHPAQDWPNNELSTSFPRGNINEFKYDLTLSACSTIGLESVIKFNTPTLYLNFHNILDHFIQTEPLKPLAIDSEKSFIKLTLKQTKNSLKQLLIKETSILEKELSGDLSNDKILHSIFKSF